MKILMAIILAVLFAMPILAAAKIIQIPEIPWEILFDASVYLDLQNSIIHL